MKNKIILCFLGILFIIGCIMFYSYLDNKTYKYTYDLNIERNTPAEVWIGKE